MAVHGLPFEVLSSPHTSRFRKDGKGGAEPNGVAGAGKKQKQKKEKVQKQAPLVFLTNRFSDSLVGHA